MEGEGFIAKEAKLYPLQFLGVEHTFFGINIETLINTWITLLVLLILLIVARYLLLTPNTLAQFVLKKFMKNFTNLIEQSVGRFVERYFYFIVSLFIFIISCNWIGLIPTVEEPTKDVNTALALGISAFIYMHKELIQAHGIVAYLKEFFLPFNIIFPLNLIAGLILLPLKLLGELATVISISFRLFGNIFGGWIISTIYKNALSYSVLLQILGLAAGFNILIIAFFVIFEGFLQAFVFSILALTNIAMAVKTETEG